MSALNFIRTPEGIRDLNYPSWLLRESRHLSLVSKRVIFLGDSVVNGWKATAEEYTISSQFAKQLAHPDMQTFTFALMGLGARDYQQICQENLRDGDYVVVQLLPLGERLEQGIILSPKAYGPPAEWRAPFLLLRGQVASSYGKAPSFLLFDGVRHAKEMIKQKSFHPILPKNYKPFSPENPTVNNVLDLRNLEQFGMPFSDKAKDGVEKLLDLLSRHRERTLIYITPLNPYYLDQRGLQINANFRSNIEWIKTLLQKNGFRYLDYVLDKRVLEMDDFIDYSHYTDEAAIKMGNILATDFTQSVLRP